jgi:hypothetical protein
MANPTSQVYTAKRDFLDTMDFFPITSANNPYTYQQGQMIGRDTSGNATNMDDSQALVFLGILVNGHLLYDSTTPAPQRFRVDRPRTFTMPLSSGTASNATDIGKVAYAVDAGHVTLNPIGASLNYCNPVGNVVRVRAANPDTISGVSEVELAPYEWDARQTYGGFLVAPATGGKTYGIEALNKIIEVPLTAAETFVLPAVANTMPGDRICFIKTGADATHAFTLQGNASENIDGANTKASNTAAYSALEVVSDGSQWLCAVTK